MAITASFAHPTRNEGREAMWWSHFWGLGGRGQDKNAFGIGVIHIKQDTVLAQWISVKHVSTGRSNVQLLLIKPAPRVKYSEVIFRAAQRGTQLRGTKPLSCPCHFLL